MSHMTASGLFFQKMYSAPSAGNSPPVYTVTFDVPFSGAEAKSNGGTNKLELELSGMEFARDGISAPEQVRDDDWMTLQFLVHVNANDPQDASVMQVDVGANQMLLVQIYAGQ